MALNMKVVIPVVVAIIVIGAVAFFLFPGMGGAPKEKVFIIVAYHWGYALYDSNYNEIDQIVVNKGDTVKIYFISARSLSEEFYSQLEERAIQQGVGGLSGDDLRAKIEEAISAGQIDHGLQITAFNVFVATNTKNFSGKAKTLKEFFQTENKDAIEQQAVTFKADKTGTFDILCYVVCGYGHSFMVRQDAIRVEG